MSSTQNYDTVGMERPVQMDRLREYDRALIHRRISWQALFAGLVIAVAVQLLLSTLGAGVGLGMVHSHASNTPNVTNFSIGAGIWWLVSNLIALAVGGYVAARLAGVTTRADGMLHGLVTWGLTTLFTVYLLTTAAGNLLGGASTIMGGTMGSATSSVKSVVAPAVKGVASSSTNTALNPQSYLQMTPTAPAAMTPQAAKAEIAAQLPIYEAGGASAPAAKQKIITIMAAQMNVSQAAATTRFDQLQAQVTNAKNQTIQSAQKIGAASAQTTSTAAYLAFGMLLLGAIFGALGGSMATPRSTLVAERVSRG
jgi:hypothetical protein